MSNFLDTKPTGTERRRWTRQTVIGSTLIPVDIGGDEAFGLIVDLSERGAAIQSVGPLELGSRNRLRFRLPTEDAWIDTAGEIVWSRNKLSGVRFLDISEPSCARIRKWLQDFGSIPMPGNHQR